MSPVIKEDVVQVQKSPIVVGNRGVGELWVDGGAVHSEGGWLHPQLVVPLTIGMDPRPPDSQVVMAWVRASLSADQPPHTSSLACPPTSELLLDGFNARSLSRVHECTVPLRFFISLAEVAALEQRRQVLGSEAFTLHMRVEGLAAGIVTHNQVEAGQSPAESPWDLQYGMFSQVLPFWHTSVHPVQFTIEESRWVREILPGLGHDRLRLLEVAFPPALPEHVGAAVEWDKARRAFDERRYSDCISECRDLLAMWGRQLDASKSQPVAAVVAARAGWDQGDVRLAFIDGIWKASTDLVNVPHHPEGHVSVQLFDREDARLMLMLTAALCEYLGGRF